MSLALAPARAFAHAQQSCVRRRLRRRRRSRSQEFKSVRTALKLRVRIRRANIPFHYIPRATRPEIRTPGLGALCAASRETKMRNVRLVGGLGFVGR